MGSEDLDERVDWEARRVAAAFGIKKWRARHNHTALGHVQFVGDIEGKTAASFFFDIATLEVFRLMSGRETIGCIVNLRRPKIALHGSGYELMARGLYCLGFEDESILSQLPRLSAHEKMELRLSLPREFWPKKWLEEKR